MSPKTLKEVSKTVQENRKRINQEMDEYYRKKAEENGQAIPSEDVRSWEEKNFVENDKYGTIDNGTATIWYIIVMAVGAVFNDRWLIWVIATAIWWGHINRKKRRQKEWDEKHKNGGKK
jgi:hypothetical protein